MPPFSYMIYSLILARKSIRKTTMNNIQESYFTIQVKSQHKDLVADYLKREGISFNKELTAPGETTFHIQPIAPDRAFYLGARLQKSLVDGAVLISH